MWKLWLWTAGLVLFKGRTQVTEILNHGLTVCVGVLVVVYVEGVLKLDQ